MARRLLVEMARLPERVEYNTRVLGGMFREGDLKRLDEAYAELADRQFVEPADAEISFFGRPKLLFRITGAGRAEAHRLSAEVA